ncbi:hypothetical protein B0186_09385, partial [Canicola haemoglobinophilus]
MLGAGSVGLGIGALVGKDNSVSIGYGVYNNSRASIGIGNAVHLSGGNKSYQIGIGNDSKVTVERGIAIGDGAQSTTLANSVALGYRSVVDYTETELAKPRYTARGSYSIPSSSKVGVLSVGARGNERRIINVASGYRDSDAVTVSQLKTIEDRLDGATEKADSKVRFFSVKSGKELQAIAQKEVDYKNYVRLKVQKLTVDARKADGKQINEANIKEIVDQLKELEKKTEIVDKATNLKALAAVNDPKYQTNNKFDIAKYMEALEAAKAADTTKEKLANILTAEEKEKLKAGNYSNEGASGADAIAIGPNAKATESNAISLGNSAEGKGQDSVAVGKGARTTGQESLAASVNARAGGSQSIAIGHYASTGKQTDTDTDKSWVGKDEAGAAGEFSIAIGSHIAVTGNKSAFIGKRDNGHTTPTVSGNQSYGMGYNTKITADNAFAFANESEASAQYAIAIGNRVKAEGEKTVVIGYDAGTHNNNAHKPTSAVIIGDGARVGHDSSIIDGGVAIGKAAKALNTNGLALGADAQATFANSVALGSNSRNTAILTNFGYNPATKVAYTSEANVADAIWKPTHGEVSVGNGSTATRRITGVAAGSADTDAVNVAQLKKVVSGSSVQYFSVNNTKPRNSNINDNLVDENINKANDKAKEGAIAIGAGAVSDVDGSVAIGYGAKNNPTTTNRPDNEKSAIAIGLDAQTIGSDTIAIGQSTRANGGNAFALGKGARGEGNGALAFGLISVSKVDNSVALGAASYVDRAAGGQGYDPNAFAVSTSSNKEWQSGYGAVSIGNVEGKYWDAASQTYKQDNNRIKTRQLIGVAAGSADTDAVNVAQLKNVTMKVTDNKTGRAANSFEKLKLSAGMMKFVGSADISATAAPAGSDVTVTFALQKGAVTSNEEKAVSGKAVYTAVSDARTTVAKDASESILNVSGGEQGGITAKAYTLSINKDALKTDVPNHK